LRSRSSIMSVEIVVSLLIANRQAKDHEH